MNGAPESATEPHAPHGADAPIGPGGPEDQRRAERSAEAMLARDPATRHLGITLERVAPGFARMRMPVSGTMLNAHGICHGGYVFTLADSTFAFACNTFNRVTVAASAHIDFLASARLDDVLYAEGRVRSRGRRSGIYDVVVEDGEGRQLALFRGRSHSLDETLYDESPDAAQSSAPGGGAR